MVLEKFFQKRAENFGHFYETTFLISVFKVWKHEEDRRPPAATASLTTWIVGNRLSTEPTLMVAGQTSLSPGDEETELCHDVWRIHLNE